MSAVEDPKSKPEAEAYFSFAKQANMDLRTDLKEMEGVRNSDHIDAIHNWSLNDVTLVDRYPALEELTNLFGEPLSSYRGNPIFYVDANNFDMMMAVIGNSSSNELALDIECNDSHSFLGNILNQSTKLFKSIQTIKTTRRRVVFYQHFF